MRSTIPSRTAAAFTLVELLVVIGIIAVLIAILLPSLAKARAGAVTLQCAANLRSIGQGLALYQGENAGYYPMGQFSVGANREGYWPVVISQALGAPQTGTFDAWNNANNAALAKGVFNCPARALDPQYAWTPASMYSGHPLIFGGSRDWDLNGFWKGWAESHRPKNLFYIYKVTWLQRPQEKIVVGDGTQFVTGIFGDTGWVLQHAFHAAGDTLWNGNYLIEEPQFWGNSAFNLGGSPDMSATLKESGTPSENANFRARHGIPQNQINFLFADGHVEVITVSKTGRTDLQYRNFAINMASVRGMY